MKKWMLLALGLSVASMGFAGGIEQPYEYKAFQGWYWGGALGYNRTSYRTDFSYEPTDDIVNDIVGRIVSFHSVYLVKNSFAGNLFLGGGAQVRWFYFGGHFLLNFAGSQVGFNPILPLFDDDIDEYPFSSSNNVKLRTTTIALDVEPGVLLSHNSLLHLILGVAFNKLKIDSSPSFIEDESTIGAARLYSGFASLNKSITGFRVGAGIKQKISSRFAVFLSYVFTLYDQKNLITLVTSPDEVPVVNAIQHYTVTPYRQDIVFGFNWYF